MVTLSLESTYAKFGSLWYKPLEGVPTGHTLSVHLANIAVYMVFNRLIYSNYHIPISFFFRFVDDGTGEWSGSVFSFYWWITSVNEVMKHRYNLELTYNFDSCENFCVFLDVQYKFINGQLVTDIYQKPTDSHQYLHYCSSHPRHVFQGIVFSQGLRFRRIINCNIRLRLRLNELTEHFRNSGYPISTMVESIFNKISSMERCLTYNSKDKEQPFHVPFIFTYGCGNNTIKHYINNNVNDALMKSNLFKDSAKPVIKTVFKKAPSIRSSTVDQKTVVLESDSAGWSKRCVSEEESKHKRGPKCQTCPMMANSNSFTLNGILFNKCDGGNCLSHNIIYMAQCKICHLGYIGKTTQSLRNRINGHRDAIESLGSLTEISDKEALSAHVLIDHQNHLNFNSVYKLYVVRNMVEPRLLLSTEQFYINTFSTRKPTGLNIDNPIKVSVLRTAC